MITDKDQCKILKKGFTIIKCDYEKFEIRQRTPDWIEWHLFGMFVNKSTFESFRQGLLDKKNIIEIYDSNSK